MRDSDISPECFVFNSIGSAVSRGRGFSKADAPKEGGVVGHGDGGVVVHHADRDPLPSTEPTHSGRVAGVELALSGLDAARAAEERIFIDHYLITRNVREVQEVHLHTRTHVHTPHTHPCMHTHSKSTRKKPGAN